MCFFWPLPLLEEKVTLFKDSGLRLIIMDFVLSSCEFFALQKDEIEKSGEGSSNQLEDV